MAIRMEKPTLRRKDMDAVLQTMADEQIGPGQHTQAFIDMFRRALGTEGSAYALRTHVDALLHALRSLRLTPGSRIAVSALSPRMYRHVIESAGHVTVVLDIDGQTGNLAFERVSGQQGLDALLLFEPYGNIPDDDDWKGLGIPIIEDISESLGSTHGERSAGLIGDVIVCAFEESSVVSTGGGSIVYAKDSDFAKGIAESVDPLLPYIVMPGMNAALGVVQFEHMLRNIERRRAIHDRFRQALMRTRHRLFGITDIEFATNGHGFVAVLDAKPEEGRQFALRYEVATSLAFPLTVISDQTDRYDLYPHAIPCIHRAVRFPLYPFLSKEQVAQIEKVISHLP